MLLLAVLVAPIAAQAENIAVVDMKSVFEQLPQRQQMDEKLKAEFSDRIAEFTSLRKKYDELVQKQKKEAQLMSEEQKTAAIRKIQALQADIERSGRNLDEDMKKRNGEETNKILMQVKTAVDAIAKKNDYDVILQRGAAIYVKPDADISAKVIEALTKKGK